MAKIWIRLAVIRLSRIAVFCFLFRLYYHAAWLIFSRLSRFLFPEIISVKTHRGYASGDWEPGISDIDSVLELCELSPEENACFIGEWSGFYRVFRLVFPVMGEPIIATRRERGLYRAWGDIRSFPAAAAPGPENSLIEAKTALDLWTECLHAHTRLCKIAVSHKLMPGPLAAREVRKCVLDIARHSASAPFRPPSQKVTSRLETERGLKDFKDFPGLALDEILRCGKTAATDDRGVKMLAQLACAHTANILERDALTFFHRFNRFTAPAADTDFFAAAAPEVESASGLLTPFKKRLGDFFDSAILDNIFSSVVILRDIPGAAGDLACCLSILDCMTEWDLSMRGAVFILGPKSYQLMGLGPYDDDPLKMCFPKALDLSEGSAACLQSGEDAPFQIHRIAFLGAGNYERLAPRQPLLDALYRESLSHFLRTWRGLLPPGPGGAIYAVSRTVSFWLYFVKGTARPCFPLQPLLEVFKREWQPDGRAGLFETSLLKGLHPADIELLSAINAETLEAAGQDAPGAAQNREP